MNKEQKCISLPLAQELQKVAKENGFELPESEYMWERKMGEWRLIHKDYYKNQKYDTADVRIWIQAYDTSELGEIIPGNIEGLVFQTQKGMLGNLYYCMMIDSIGYAIRHQEEATTEAEVRGQMFSYLIKNKLT